MADFNELEMRLDDAKLCYRAPLIKAIGQANLSVGEISDIISVPEGVFYKVLRNNEDPWPEMMADLSVVLGVPVSQLFPTETEGFDG